MKILAEGLNVNEKLLSMQFIHCEKGEMINWSSLNSSTPVWSFQAWEVSVC